MESGCRALAFGRCATLIFFLVIIPQQVTQPSTQLQSTGSFTLFILTSPRFSDLCLYVLLNVSPQLGCSTKPVSSRHQVASIFI